MRGVVIILFLFLSQISNNSGQARGQQIESILADSLVFDWSKLTKRTTWSNEFFLVPLTTVSPPLREEGRKTYDTVDRMGRAERGEPHFKTNTSDRGKDRDISRSATLLLLPALFRTKKQLNHRRKVRSKTGVRVRDRRQGIRQGGNYNGKTDYAVSGNKNNTDVGLEAGSVINTSRNVVKSGNTNRTSKNDTSRNVIKSDNTNKISKNDTSRNVVKSDNTNGTSMNECQELSEECMNQKIFLPILRSFVRHCVRFMRRLDRGLPDMSPPLVINTKDLIREIDSATLTFHRAETSENIAIGMRGLSHILYKLEKRLYQISLQKIAGYAEALESLSAARELIFKGLELYDSIRQSLSYPTSHKNYTYLDLFASLNNSNVSDQSRGAVEENTKQMAFDILTNLRRSLNISDIEFSQKTVNDIRNITNIIQSLVSRLRSVINTSGTPIYTTTLRGATEISGVSDTVLSAEVIKTINGLASEVSTSHKITDSEFQENVTLALPLDKVFLISEAVTAVPSTAVIETSILRAATPENDYKDLHNKGITENANSQLYRTLNNPLNVSSPLNGSVDLHVAPSSTIESTLMQGDSVIQSAFTAVTESTPTTASITIGTTTNVATVATTNRNSEMLINAAVVKMLNKLVSKVSVLQKLMDSKFIEDVKLEGYPETALLDNLTSASSKETVAKLAITIIREEAIKLQKICRRLLPEVIITRMRLQMYSLLEKLLKQTYSLAVIVDSELPNTLEVDLGLLRERQKEEHELAFRSLEEVRESQQLGLSKQEVGKKLAKVARGILKIVQGTIKRIWIAVATTATTTASTKTAPSTVHTPDNFTMPSTATLSATNSATTTPGLIELRNLNISTLAATNSTTTPALNELTMPDTATMSVSTPSLYELAMPTATLAATNSTTTKSAFNKFTMPNTATSTATNSTTNIPALNELAMPNTAASTATNSTTNKPALNELAMPNTAASTATNSTTTKPARFSRSATEHPRNQRYALNELAMPNTSTSIAINSTTNIPALNELTMPNTAPSTAINSTTNKPALNELTMPNTATSTAINSTTNIHALNELAMPNTAASTAINSTTKKHALNELTMPNTATSTAINSTTNKPALNELTTPNTAASTAINSTTNKPALNELTTPNTATLTPLNTTTTGIASEFNGFRKLSGTLISHTFINDVVIKMLNKLVSTVSALQETAALACRRCEQTGIKTHGNDSLLLGNISSSEDKAVLVMKVISVIRTEATKLHGIHRRISIEFLKRRMRTQLYNALKEVLSKAITLHENANKGLSVNMNNSYTSVELENKKMQALELLQEERDFQQLDKREVSEKSVKVILIVSTIIQDVIRQFKNAITDALMTTNTALINPISNATDLYETFTNSAVIENNSSQLPAQTNGGSTSSLSQSLSSTITGTMSQDLRAVLGVDQQLIPDVLIKADESNANVSSTTKSGKTSLDNHATQIPGQMNGESTSSQSQRLNSTIKDILSEDFPAVLGVDQQSMPDDRLKADESNANVSNTTGNSETSLENNTSHIPEQVNGGLTSNLSQGRSSTEEDKLSLDSPEIVVIHEQPTSVTPIKAVESTSNVSNMTESREMTLKNSRPLATEQVNGSSNSNRPQSNKSSTQKDSITNDLLEVLGVHKQSRSEVKEDAAASNASVLTMAESSETSRKHNRALTQEQMNGRSVRDRSKTFSPIQKVDEDNCGCRQKEVVTGAEYNVYHIKKGTRVKKVDPRDVNNPSEFQVDGLDKVDRYKNTNVALEFAFKRPLLMSAIGFTTTPNNTSGLLKESASVKLATIYLEKATTRNVWLPLLTNDTKSVKLFNIMSSNTLHSLAKSNDTLGGIRLYPQEWSTNPATIGRPIFVYCASNP